METGALHLSDYLPVWRRRKVQVMVPAIVIFLVSVGLAFGIPPLYRSTATILIEQLEIPETLIGTTITDFANERIKTISWRIMTRDNLRQIVEKSDLYAEKRQTQEIDDVVEAMRENIEVETETPGKESRIARSTKASIPFNVSFFADTPEVARSVAGELVSLYLNENLKKRGKKTAEVASGFLVQEQQRLAQHVPRLEAELAAHKERNVGRLPELMRLNLQQMERIERDLEETERQIFKAEERKIYLESKLAELEPTTGSSPAARLRELQTQYLSASALYAPDHPDLVRMRREIELLKKGVGGVNERDAIIQQLTTTRAELEAAHQKYLANHPDIIRLTKSVETLTEALENTSEAPKTDVSVKPDNPAYISVETELNAVKLSLKAAQGKRRRTKARFADYERRLAEMPRVEQAGLALKREYDDTVKKHKEITKKLLELELAEELEWEQKGERYSLLESPELPRKPAKPNRPAIVLLGFVLSLGAGIAYASFVEYMDRTIRGSKSVSTLLGAPPLAVIPNIQAEPDPYQKRRSR